MEAVAQSLRNSFSDDPTLRAIAESCIASTAGSALGVTLSKNQLETATGSVLLGKTSAAIPIDIGPNVAAGLMAILFNVVSMWLWESFRVEPDSTDKPRAPTEEEIARYIEKTFSELDNAAESLARNRNVVSHDLAQQLVDQRFDFWLNLWERAANDSGEND